MATSGPSLKALPPLLPDPPHPSFPYILISRLICCLAPLLPSLIPPIFPHHARRCLKEEKDCCSWFSLSRCATPVPTSFPHSPSDPSLPFFFFFSFFFAPPCTGKSSLVIQYIENHFVESYYPTIESTFSKSINYQGIDYDCDIIDTAGQVRSPSSPPSPYNDSLTTSSATPPFHHRTSLQSSTPNMPSVFMAMFSYIQSLPESHLK